jgi:hypothetical protein
MKDLRCIYRPYIPKILLNGKRLKYNLSDESIFGNLNYSIKPDIIESINKWRCARMMENQKNANV